MPYILPEDRKKFDKTILKLAKKLRKFKGKEKYTRTSSVILDTFLQFYNYQFRYADINEIMGVLTCALEEWMRRKDGVEGYTDNSTVFGEALIPYGGEYDLIEELSDLLKCNTSLSGTAGNFNYCITKLLTEVFSPLDKLTAVDREEVPSILATVRGFFYDNYAIPYEDTKVDMNGDVFYSKEKRSVKKKIQKEFKQQVEENLGKQIELCGEAFRDVDLDEIDEPDPTWKDIAIILGSTIFLAGLVTMSILNAVF